MRTINFSFSYTNEKDVMEKNVETLVYFESNTGNLTSYDIDIGINESDDVNEYMNEIIALQNTMSSFNSIDFENLDGIDKITEIHEKIYSKIDENKFIKIQVNLSFSFDKFSNDIIRNMPKYLKIDC